jgi:hypothetical protein
MLPIPSISIPDTNVPQTWRTNELWNVENGVYTDGESLAIVCDGGAFFVGPGSDFTVYNDSDLEDGPDAFEDSTWVRAPLGTTFTMMV